MRHLNAQIYDSAYILDGYCRYNIDPIAHIWNSVATETSGSTLDY